MKPAGTSMMCRSEWHTPDAATRTSTSPGPGSGTATSRSSGGRCHSVNWNARMRPACRSAVAVRHSGPVSHNLQGLAFRAVTATAPELPTPTESAATTGPEGLSAAAVADRVARGQVNTADDRTSRTLSEIARANIFTRFNAILGSMLVVILIVGPIQDALFGIVLVANALIGIVQEYRAKRTLDRLAVLNAPRARVVRDGQTDGDRGRSRRRRRPPRAADRRPGPGRRSGAALGRARGGRVAAHRRVRLGGEVGRRRGALRAASSSPDPGRCQAVRVGADSYARRLAHEARRFTLVRSELMDGINLILRYVTWAIIPTAALLALSQFRAHEGWREAMAGVVAGVVAMVPEGLVLLTSLSFAIAAVTLAAPPGARAGAPRGRGARAGRRRVPRQDRHAHRGNDRVRRDRAAGRQRPGRGRARCARGRRERATRPPPHSPKPFRRPTVGRAPPRSRSRRRASGAAPRSPGTAHGCSAHPRWSGSTSRPTIPCAAGPTSSRPPGGGCCCSRTASSRFGGEALPGGLEAVALVMFKEKIRPDAADTLAYFTRAGCRAEGHLRRQPADGRRGGPQRRPHRCRRCRRRA